MARLQRGSSSLLSESHLELSLVKCSQARRCALPLSYPAPGIPNNKSDHDTPSMGRAQQSGGCWAFQKESFSAKGRVPWAPGEISSEAPFTHDLTGLGS